MTPILPLADEEQQRIETNRKIAAQNDLFRTSLGTNSAVQGMVVWTTSVALMPLPAREIVVQRVQSFTIFNEENDPYEDHCFGAFEVESEGRAYFILWKIDLYDTDFENGSDDPANLQVTRRVLTIMQSHEY